CLRPSWVANVSAIAMRPCAKSSRPMEIACCGVQSGARVPDRVRGEFQHRPPFRWTHSAAGRHWLGARSKRAFFVGNLPSRVPRMNKKHIAFLDEDQVLRLVWLALCDTAADAEQEIKDWFVPELVDPAAVTKLADGLHPRDGYEELLERDLE